MMIGDTDMRGTPHRLLEVVEKLRGANVQVNMVYDADDGVLTVFSSHEDRHGAVAGCGGDLAIGGGTLLSGEFECDGYSADEVRTKLIEATGMP